jgi:predicted Abi (CAAX) family protease
MLAVGTAYFWWPKMADNVSWLVLLVGAVLLVLTIVFSTVASDLQYSEAAKVSFQPAFTLAQITLALAAIGLGIPLAYGLLRKVND